MSVRNRSLERTYLQRAERAAGTVGYAAAVTARVDDYGRAHGDTFDERPVEELLAEIREEALDLGGWGSLALTVLEVEALPPAARERVVASLDAIAAAAAECVDRVDAARRAVDAQRLAERDGSWSPAAVHEPSPDIQPTLRRTA